MGEAFIEGVRLSVLKTCMHWIQQPPEMRKQAPEALLLLAKFLATKLLPQHEEWGETVKNVVRSELFSTLVFVYSKFLSLTCVVYTRSYFENAME